MPPATSLHVVASLWARMQARDWAGVRALLHDDATLHWVTSGEHFDDADAIVRVNAIYPEGWTIRVVAVDAMANGDVHSIVEVMHPPRRFFANSRFVLEAGRIRRISEHWSTFESPPDWRNAQAIGAYRRDPQAAST